MIFIIFVEIINNEKIEENDEAYDDVCILYVKRYIMTYNKLER
jgi:hypothetical protein